MKIPLTAINITTRDGSLAKDSKATNVIGGLKRPGLQQVAALPVGAAQALFNSPTLGPLAIIGNTIYTAAAAPTTVAVIPSGVGPYDVVEALPSGLIAFKDAFHIWTLLGSVVTLVTRSSAQNMCPGFEYLDGTYYVLAVNGELQGSDLNNPASWPALNYLLLNADFGTPVAISKQLNYIVGFSDKFAMFYYDAGNPPPGSPLLPVQSSYMDIGCAAAGALQQVGGSLVFMGKTATRGRSIYLIIGTQYQVISDMFVDKILERSTLASVSCFTIKIAGKELYVLTLGDLAISLVFDFNSKQWTVWTSSTTPVVDPVVQGNYAQVGFSWNSYLAGSGMDLLLHDTSGVLCQMRTDVYVDNGLPIDVHFVSTELEGETSDYLRVGAVEVVGDKVVGTAYIRYSDSDYASWSGYLTVDLSRVRSQAVRQGATRRRAYHVRHTGNGALNLRTLNLDVMK